MSSKLWLMSVRLLVILFSCANAHVMSYPVEDDFEDLITRLERVSPTLLAQMTPAINEIRRTIDLAGAAGLSRPVLLQPLMWGPHHAYFKAGVCVEVVRKTKRWDVLAAAGR